jgi:hypothetical protein
LKNGNLVVGGLGREVQLFSPEFYLLKQISLSGKFRSGIVIKDLIFVG